MAALTGIVDPEQMAKELEELDKKTSDFVLEWFSELRAERTIWDRLWQETRELVRPNAEDFLKKVSPAISRTRRIYDPTPTKCLANLAAGIQSNLTNSADRWFGLSTGNNELDVRPEVALFLQKEANGIYDDIYNSKAGFAYASHELYMDWAGFGTAIFSFIEDNDQIMFKAIPLAECYISENQFGIVDVVFRKFPLSKRAAKMKFGFELPKEALKGKDKEKKMDFIHAVYPVEGSDGWTSVYIHMDSGKIVSKKIFREFPYCVLRWSKFSGDVYGRAPGTDNLTYIRVLNDYGRIILQSNQVVSAPPIMMEDDGVLSDAVLKPFARWMVRPGSKYPEAFDLKGTITVTREMINDLRTEIKEAFYNDIFEGTDYGNRDRVTGQEVQVDQASKLRRIAPVTGRAEIEFLGPIIRRIAKFREEKGRSFPVPMALRGQKIKIIYLSPASMALRAIKAQNTLKFVETVVPFLQYDPQLLDGIDMDKVMLTSSFAMGIDETCRRSEADKQALRNQRAQQQQQQAASEQAMNATQGIKNVAQARQADPSMGGLLPQ
jgi:hypothetical protein